MPMLAWQRRQRAKKTWIKAEKYNKNKKQDDPSCFFMRKNETLFGLYSIKLRKLNQERGRPFDLARLILRIGILRHMQLLCKLGLS